jgi:hypothetical protein
VKLLINYYVNLTPITIGGFSDCQEEEWFAKNRMREMWNRPGITLGGFCPWLATLRVDLLTWENIGD